MFSEGSHHLVYELNDGKVLKIPKDTSPIGYTQAVKSQDFFDRFFPDFVPKTIVTTYLDTRYRIHQERIYNTQYISDILGKPDEVEILCKLHTFLTRAQFILDYYFMGFDIGGTSKFLLDGGGDNPLLINSQKLMQITNFIIGSTIDSPEQKKLFFIDTIVSSRSIGGFPLIIATISSRRRKELKKRKDYIHDLLDEIDDRLKKIP
ncbi:hypothetical protein KBB25_00315 [Candidatus Gracilibacteria bacterium]|nr:hypothetical protein [Candidatus Gracilibacteria bacterium]